MLARAKPLSHLLRSGVHLPAPPGLVVLINPSAARVSASFSPSQISTVAFGGAASSSGNRYGIAGPAGLPFTQCPFSRWYCGNDFFPLLVTRLTTLRYSAPLRLR